MEAQGRIIPKASLKDSRRIFICERKTCTISLKINSIQDKLINVKERIGKVEEGDIKYDTEEESLDRKPDPVIKDHPSVRMLLERYWNEYNSGNREKIDLYEHTIRLLQGGVINKKNYRLSEDKKEFVRNEISRLLEEGTIEESNSRYNNPILCVPKKGSFRLCLDFRELNKISVKELVPPPEVDEILDGLHDMRFFSKIDVKDGYHNVKLEANSGKYTAFTTHFGKFQYRRMPFGLNNAPATFQNIMYIALQKEIGRCCYAFMDDVIIFSENEIQHQKDVQEVLRRLAQWKLKLNMEKCCFFQKEMEFLGYTIKDNEISPDTKSIQKLKLHLQVKNQKDLQKALGFLGYHRRYLKNYAEKTSWFYKAFTESDDTIRGCEEGINALKNEIIHSHSLHLPDFQREFIMRQMHLILL